MTTIIRAIGGPNTEIIASVISRLCSCARLRSNTAAVTRMAKNVIATNGTSTNCCEFKPMGRMRGALAETMAVANPKITTSVATTMPAMPSCMCVR